MHIYIVATILAAGFKRKVFKNIFLTFNMSIEIKFSVMEWSKPRPITTNP